ncbi:MAG: DUF5363 domain-containing protein [Alysiella sp.]|uniref:DUF5363 domain-containing protein n=1 Tax=Alysiella sp. TaxID=1872483 RepID=UPI0026DBFD79|nr:DUF5363 domain-containing protein [Alysiella sp.]MDO4433060.1 DUF5363 domain-containing protein [Alysiella sp.]
MAETEQEKPSFWRKLLNSYDQLCKDMGVEQGGCRSCVPKIQFDENGKRIDRRLPETQPHSPENKN